MTFCLVTSLLEYPRTFCDRSWVLHASREDQRHVGIPIPDGGWWKGGHWIIQVGRSCLRRSYVLCIKNGLWLCLRVFFPCHSLSYLSPCNLCGICRNWGGTTEKGAQSTSCSWEKGTFPCRSSGPARVPHCIRWWSARTPHQPLRSVLFSELFSLEKPPVDAVLLF